MGRHFGRNGYGNSSTDSMFSSHNSYVLLWESDGKLRLLIFGKLRFPLTLRTNGQNNTPTITAVKSKFQVKAGYVGISLKRPDGATNDIAFHFARQKIQPA